MTVGKLFKLSSKPDQPGLSNSIRLKLYACEPTTCNQTATWQSKYVGLVYTTFKRIELESPGCWGFEAS